MPRVAKAKSETEIKEEEVETKTKSKTETKPKAEPKAKKETKPKAEPKKESKAVTQTNVEEPSAETPASKEPEIKKEVKLKKEKKPKSDKIFFYGTGRRKKSIARVRLSVGSGEIIINGKPLDEFFGLETLKLIVRQPLNATNSLDKYDIICKVTGGGFAGQAGAIRHGISRALLKANGEYRPILKSLKLLTRDSRMKERKKYGLKKARKAPQFSKR